MKTEKAKRHAPVAMAAGRMPLRGGGGGRPDRPAVTVHGRGGGWAHGQLAAAGMAGVCACGAPAERVCDACGALACAECAAEGCGRAGCEGPMVAPEARTPPRPGPGVRF